jgi:hypothetical protein
MAAVEAMVSTMWSAHTLEVSGNNHAVTYYQMFGYSFTSKQLVAAWPMIISAAMMALRNDDAERNERLLKILWAVRDVQVWELRNLDGILVTSGALNRSKTMSDDQTRRQSLLFPGLETKQEREEREARERQEQIDKVEAAAAAGLGGTLEQSLKTEDRHTHTAKQRERRAREGAGRQNMLIFMLNFSELPTKQLEENARCWEPDELTDEVRRAERREGFEFMRASLGDRRWRWYQVRTDGENVQAFTMTIYPREGHKPLRLAHPGFVKVDPQTLAHTTGKTSWPATSTQTRRPTRCAQAATSTSTTI